MKVIETKLQEVKIIEPQIFGDDRGFFFENYQEERYQQMLGIKSKFVQDNVSRSSKSVLRGLHYQTKNTQGKLVTVLNGTVLDVVVDVRVGSPTFGNWISVELSSENKRQLWVPQGFAHGFLVLSQIADFYYKCDAYYDPLSEKSILWNDQDIRIDWKLSEDAPPNLSKKDTSGVSLKNISINELPRY